MCRGVAVFVCCIASVATAQNPCTNGSFEELGPDGFAIDWSPVGTVVEASPDAHSGSYSLRLLREEESPAAETGLNRRWYPESGRGDGLIDRTRGGMEFYYKAIHARSANLTVMVIPMNEQTLEDTTTQRAVYEVPEAHIGDGQWHVARIKYDYSNAPHTRWVHFGARVLGGAGELLLDDITYLEEVGPLFRFERTRLERDEADPTNAFVYYARVANRGDRAIEGGQLQAAAPEGMRVEPSQSALPPLDVDGHVDLSWRVSGDAGVQPGVLELTAASGDAAAKHHIAIAPDLRLAGFGPVEPVATVGAELQYEAVLENVGDASAPPQRLELHAPYEGAPGARVYGHAVPPIAPGTRQTVRVLSEPADSAGSRFAELLVTASDGSGSPLRAKTRVVILPVVGSPDAVAQSDPAQRQAESFACIQNAHVRLVVHRGATGFAAAELCAFVEGEWRRGAWIPVLSRVVADTAVGTPWVWEPEPATAETLTGERSSDLLLTAETTDPDGVGWRATMRFSLDRDTRQVTCRYEAAAAAPRALRAFDGPMVYVLDREEAVFPGLEWLVDDEVSSSSLDVEEGHPHQVRYVPDANMVTIPAIAVKSSAGVFGLLWDVHQEWAPGHRKPAAAFASPDRFGNQRAHLMGLFAPSAPEFVEPNDRAATKPFAMSAPVQLECRIYADGSSTDVLSVYDAYLAQTELPAPTPLPTGSYDGEIVFGSAAYLESLWVEQDRKWLQSKRGPAQFTAAAFMPSYAADLLLAAQLTPDDELRRRCLDRVTQALPQGDEPLVHYLRWYGGFDRVLLNSGYVSTLLAARDEEGAWRFDADYEDQGVFKGFDYHILGPDGAVAVGSCAEKAYQVLRYARMTGDMRLYERMLPTLEFMCRFRVPRAAQVWEVPFHSPDILASADAVDAYIEAYRLSGDARWLNEARRWARTGLPFVYLWQEEEHPYLLGGSIPVFGASLRQYSWFGNIVQWNGLRYATAILKLAEYDGSWPWVKVAQLITHSAVQQQARNGEDAALWPDSVSALTAQKSPWVFAPRQIYTAILALTGRDEEPKTVYIPANEGRIAVTAAATLDEARLDDAALTVRVRYPVGFDGVVVFANLARPTAVLVSGMPIEERDRVELGGTPGFRYAPDLCTLAVRLGAGAAAEAVVRVEGVQYMPSDRLPEERDTVSFGFDAGTEGWTALNHVDDLRPVDGALQGRITGADPYVGRGMLRVAGDSVAAVVVRMRTDAAGTGQLYWGTTASTNVDEAKVMLFEVIGDGQFHDYRIAVGEHPEWRGRTISQLRIDPLNGVGQGVFAIDYVRSE